MRRNVTFQISKLHAGSNTSSATLSSEASPSSGESIRRSASMTFSRASSRVRQLDDEMRERRALLARTAETYLALADRLDDEIAALEAARRLASPAADSGLEELLESAERRASHS